MKIHFHIMFVIILMGYLPAHQPYALNNSSTPKRIVAMYNHAEKPRSNFTLEQIPWSKITHLMYANATINLTDFSLSFPDTMWNALLYCNSLRQGYDVRMLISLGGPGNSSFFKKGTSTIAQITTFTKNCITLIKALSLDGINISWNWPIDTLESEAYLKLIKSMRTVTDSIAAKEKKQFLLTVSIPGKIDCIDGTNGKIDIARTASLVDWFNIETHDYHTASDSFTCHHSPVYKNALDRSDFFPIDKPSTYNCDSVIRYLTLTCGVPSEKINIGTAFYGRSWENVEQSGEMYGLFQKGSFRDSTRGSRPFGIDDFYVLHAIEQSQTELCHYDSISHEPWIYDTINKIFHTYENERSVKEKCAFILKNNLGGICISNISGDAQTDEGGFLLTSAIYSILTPETITFKQKQELPGFTAIKIPASKQVFYDLRGAVISRNTLMKTSSASGTYIISKNGTLKKVTTISYH